MKPILFNTDMVRAILDNRKTVTRRAVKPQPKWSMAKAKDKFEFFGYVVEKGPEPYIFKPPFHLGDILYVRETWTVWGSNYEYKADVDDGYGPFCTSCILDICAGDCNSVIKWRPSIHMPREAARIFLRVTGVRVERLQDMTEGDVIAEGAEPLVVCRQEHTISTPDGGEQCWNYHPCKGCPAFKTLQESFGERVWNSTIKPADRALYGWAANPWVWVIGFERISREEASNAV